MDDALRVDHDLDRARPARRTASCASITSSPLFIIVAESTEILRPITQFGCAHASSGVTPASSPARVSGTGRPRRSARCVDAPSSPGLPHSPRQALEDRVVLAVDRQQGRAAALHRRHEQRAADDQRFLVGEQHALAGARPRPASARGRRRRRWPPSRCRLPGALRSSTSAVAPERARVSARRAPASASRNERCAASALGDHGDTRLESRGNIAPARRRRMCAVSCRVPRSARGWRATTSSVLAPIEPVAPRCVMLRAVRGLALSERAA